MEIAIPIPGFNMRKTLGITTLILMIMMAGEVLAGSKNAQVRVVPAVEQAMLYPEIGYELKTQYATIIYEKEEQLQQFNKRVSLGSLSYLNPKRNKNSITVVDKVKNKLDVIVERVKTILDMFPGDLKFRIMLLPSDANIQKIYRYKYQKSVDYIAFYSPEEKTIFISVNDIKLEVLAHELAHVILDHYFAVSPPVKIHEVLAQFVENHLKD